MFSDYQMLILKPGQRHTWILFPHIILKQVIKRIATAQRLQILICCPSHQLDVNAKSLLSKDRKPQIFKKFSFTQQPFCTN